MGVAVPGETRKRNGVEIIVEPSALLALAALVILTDLRAAAEVLAAVAIHEAGHLLAMVLLGVRPEELRFSATGARIGYRALLSYPREIAIAAAGPAASLAASFLTARLGGEALIPFAGLNLLYCLLNLLPVSVADGGRILAALLAVLLGPEAAWAAGRGTDIAVTALLMAAGVFAFAETRGNPTLILCAVFLLNSCCNEAGSVVKYH